MSRGATACNFTNVEMLTAFQNPFTARVDG